jgi:hypothetical protein
VSSAVDEPGGVEEEAVSQKATGVEGNKARLSPELHGNDGREQEAPDEHEGEIVAALEGADGVREEVREVQLSSLLLDLKNGFQTGVYQLFHEL